LLTRALAGVRAMGTRPSDSHIECELTKPGGPLPFSRRNHGH